MDGENKFSYPTLDRVKIESLLAILKNTVDVVIVDCTSSIHNAITSSALKVADVVIRIVNPDIKSVWTVNTISDSFYKVCNLN